jgi:hypothetical protein
MMYLKFDNLEQAVSEITKAGLRVTDYDDHFYGQDSWGTILQIPTKYVLDGESQVPIEFETCANLYGADVEALKPFEIASPLTPYNVIA